MKFKNFITRPCVLIILSAFFSALPLTFSWLFPLSWISFVPFFYVIIKHSDGKLKSIFGRGVLFGLIYHVCIYYWFLWFYPLDFANLTRASSAAVVCLAVFGISILHGALWCIPFIGCFIAGKISKNPLFLSFAAVLGILAAQKITLLSELSFPWARISLGQYTATPLIQAASLFGIDGVDTVILAVNALISICFITPPKKRVAAALAAVLIFTANLSFGLVRIATVKNGEAITVMTVQASIEQTKKWSSSGDKICYAVYSDLTKANLTDGVDLILWPESAVPKVYKSEKSLKQYKKLSKELGVPILAGVLLKGEEANTNNAVLITKDGVKANYSKRQLVPFGEYMPYQKSLLKIFPFLGELNIVKDDYTNGHSSVIMNVKNGKIGSIICFESIYPNLSRQSVKDGAQLLIEVTNDSWLKDSPAMTQHLAHGVFRSVENGRYLVRSANSGISAVIDSRGKVTQQLAANRQGTITETVHFCNETTLYNKIGNLLFPTLVSAFIILSTVLLIKKSKKTAK